MEWSMNHFARETGIPNTQHSTLHAGPLGFFFRSFNRPLTTPGRFVEDKSDVTSTLQILYLKGVNFTKREEKQPVDYTERGL